MKNTPNSLNALNSHADAPIDSAIPVVIRRSTVIYRNGNGRNLSMTIPKDVVELLKLEAGHYLMVTGDMSGGGRMTIERADSAGQMAMGGGK